VCSRLGDQRIGRKELEPALNPVLEVPCIAYFRVGLGYRIGNFRNVVVADSPEMS